MLGVDAVREYNVLGYTYGAEYGKRAGGQITVVTTSGTNHARPNEARSQSWIPPSIEAVVLAAASSVIKPIRINRTAVISRIWR